MTEIRMMPVLLFPSAFYFKSPSRIKNNKLWEKKRKEKAFGCAKEKLPLYLQCLIPVRSFDDGTLYSALTAT